MMVRFIIGLWLLVFLACPIGALAQQQGGPVQPPPPLPGQPGHQITPPPLKKIAPGEFEIGGVHLLKNEGKVIFPATVNMDKGLLEYLIVGEAGKVHESLLRTKIEPYSLQIALLLLGLEGTASPLAEQGDPRAPEGDPVTLWISFKQGASTKTIPIEEWVLNQESGKTLMPMTWVFTGSVIAEGIFMAQVEKSIVAVFRDPVAMIDNPLPGGASDEMWFVNEKAVLPVGTEVSVIIRKETK